MAGVTHRSEVRWEILENVMVSNEQGIEYYSCSQGYCLPSLDAILDTAVLLDGGIEHPGGMILMSCLGPTFPDGILILFHFNLPAKGTSMWGLGYQFAGTGEGATNSLMIVGITC